MKTWIEWVFGTALVSVLFIVLPVFVPGDFYFPFITGKAFLFRILVGCAVIAWLYLAFTDERYRPRFSWVSLAFGALTTIMLIANVLGVNPLKSMFSNFERMEGWVTLVHLFFYVLILEAFFRAEAHRFKLYVWWSLGVSVFVASYGALQALGVFDVHQSATRLDASLGNAAYFAAYLLFHIFFSAWLFLNEKGWKRVVAGCLCVAFIPLLLLTETRGAIFGVVAGVVTVGALYMFLTKGTWRVVGILSILVPVIALSSLMVLRDSDFVRSQPVLSRVASVSLEDLSTRFTIWGIAWQGFLERPLLGYGQEGFNVVFNKFYDPSLLRQEPWFDRAHNSFIDWMIAGGILGLIAYISVWILSAVGLFRRLREDRSHAILIGGFVAYAVHSFFVFDNLISYILFGVLVAYAGTLLKPGIERVGGQSTRLGYVAASISGAIVLVLVFTLHIPGVVKNQALLQAASPAASFEDMVIRWQRVFAIEGFLGTQEAREQLVNVANTVAFSESVPIENRTQFVSFAISEMKKQVEEHPGDARSLVIYFSILRLLDQSGESERVIEEAIALSPKKQRLYFERGNYEIMRGRLEDAEVWFQKAYDLDPSFDEPAQLLAMSKIIQQDVQGGEQVLIDHFGTRDVYHPALVFAYQAIGNAVRAGELEALAP